ncbi:hypothetical protein O9993_09415 [Vibrio lentus]|nr:hypothetical protein [Vibrio lentus]
MVAPAGVAAAQELEKKGGVSLLVDKKTTLKTYYHRNVGLHQR